MHSLHLLRETEAQYRKHQWTLRRILATPPTLAALPQSGLKFAPEVMISEHEVDALWFARPSHNGREAWELRLLAPTPYALFEAFEPDEAEEDREEVRADAEARLREYVRVKSGQ